MDILNYSPKSLSELSGGSCTPLSQIQCTDTMPITQSDVKGQSDAKTNELINSVIAAPANVTASVINAGGVATAPHTESAYVDEIYTKISEYYRGIFSNLDLKDPNINEDVLNYYQLIRQFYEQTMAANIQRNKVTGFNATALPTDGGKCPATIDLTISKPTPLAPFVGINESFRNNININIENNDLHGNDGGGGGGAGGSDNGVAKVNAANLNVKPIDTVATTENKVTISSAGVSINVSSTLNSNSLKISCNTTPPKKRYSIYNHPNDTDQTIQNKSTAINLNAKFNAARHENGTAISLPSSSAISLPSAPTTTTTPTAIATNNSTAAATTIDAVRMRNSGGDGSGNGNPITDIIPITSTYLQLMRSMGFSEEDAMRFDNVVSFSFNIRFLFIIIIRRLPSHFPLRNKAIAFNRVFYDVNSLNILFRFFAASSVFYFIVTLVATTELPRNTVYE